MTICILHVHHLPIVINKSKICTSFKHTTLIFVTKKHYLTQKLQMNTQILFVTAHVIIKNVTLHFFENSINIASKVCK